MRLSLSLVLALVLALAGNAYAVDKAKASAAFKQGVQHFRLAEYTEALASFKVAYRNYEEPTFLFNIAQCERQLGHKQDAVRIYRSYLVELPSAPNRVEVEALVAKLEASIAEDKLAEQAKAREAAAAAAAAAAPAVAAPVLTVATPPPPPPKQPLYKKWWLWTAVGVAAVGIGLGVGLGVGLRSSSLSGTTLGVAHPF